MAELGVGSGPLSFVKELQTGCLLKPNFSFLRKNTGRVARRAWVARGGLFLSVFLGWVLEWPLWVS